MSALTQYLDFYQQTRATLEERSTAVMNAQRAEALDVLQRHGLPSRKVERYKYTDIEAHLAPDYGISLRPLKFPKLSYCCSIAEAPSEALQYYGKIADKDDALVALNSLLALDALVVYVPRHQVAEHPIQITHVLRGNQDLMQLRRLLIVLEEGAQASVVITDSAASQQRFLTSQVIEVHAGAGSVLHLYEVEETHLLCTRHSSLFVHQEASSHVYHSQVTLFNGTTRNRTDVTLAGPYAETTLYGCVITDKMQKVDNNTLIHHKASHCQSDQLYKYVLDDSAEGAFAGRILVDEGAQKTLSRETNANLLATTTARMYSQPMLEIYADDVKCSHGSTVGQMDAQALFYMQQRGIPLAEARMLLKSAFITEVIDHIPLERLRERLEILVNRRLRGELSKCEGCQLCK